MRVAVTGAGGMLGHDVLEAARAGGHEVAALSRAELDLRDEGATKDAIATLRPEVIVNCAAFTDVDGAEANEAEALAINGAGAGNLARSATEAGAHLVHVSTDYVFDGKASRPYVESDPTAPRSAYGRTKLAGEFEVLAADPRHAVVRSSWLFGVAGHSFPRTMLELASGGREEVSVVTDQVGCPTYTAHLAAALVTVAERRSRGIHHIAAAGHCSWHELAVVLFERAGVNCRVLEATSKEMARPAPRPAWSVLASERPDAVQLPSWQEGIGAYLEAQSRAAVAS